MTSKSDSGGYTICAGCLGISVAGFSAGRAAAREQSRQVFPMHRTGLIPSLRFLSLRSAAAKDARRLALVLTSAAALAGCAAPGSGGATKSDESVYSARVEQKSVRDRAQGRGEPKSAAAAPMPATLPTSTPDAVIRVDQRTGGFSERMERRLRRIAEAAKKDVDVFVRLESYVPSGCSPALDLGRADDNLQRVREKLQRLGVSPRRILLAPFGAEYDDEVDHHRPWIEVYLLYTHPSVTYESAKSNAP